MSAPRPNPQVPPVEPEPLREVDGPRRSTVQSVTRAFEILTALRTRAASLSAVEVAAATGLDRTVAHRLLRTLAREEMVVEERGKFGLGPASVLLARGYLDSLLVRHLALPYLLDVQTGAIGDKPWTVSLSIPVGDVATAVERIWTRSVPLDAVLGIGDTFPIDRSAAGRSMLAFYPEPDAVALVGQDRYQAVAPILEEVREAGGIALSRREAHPAVHAISAAILSRTGMPIASIAVSGPDLGTELGYDSTLAGQLRRAARAVGQGLT
jgi:IclR family acetate operon transcriptional repressor